MKKRTKALFLVLFLCISIAVTLIGTKSLFGDYRWVDCEETGLPKCINLGCYVDGEYTISYCIIYGCRPPEMWHDCFEPFK